MEHKVTISYFETFLTSSIQTLVGYLPKVAGAIIIWIIGNWIINRISKVISKTMENREFDISLRGFLKSLIAVSFKILLLFSIAGMLGFETTSFVTVLGAAGLAIGLALQGSLSNFAGGVLILIFKPFKVGDLIEAQGKIGTVQEIQIFNSILLTSDNKSVIIPNGPLSNGTIVNFTKEGTLIFEFLIDINVKNSFETVKDLILNVLNKDSRIENPKVGIQKIGGVMTITIKGSTVNEDSNSVVTDSLIQIHKTFEVNNIIY